MLLSHRLYFNLFCFARGTFCQIKGTWQRQKLKNQACFDVNTAIMLRFESSRILEDFVQAQRFFSITLYLWLFFLVPLPCHGPAVLCMNAIVIIFLRCVCCPLIFGGIKFSFVDHVVKLFLIPNISTRRIGWWPSAPSRQCGYFGLPRALLRIHLWIGAQMVDGYQLDS